MKKELLKIKLGDNSLEKQLQNIYQEIADTVNQMIPEEWGKVYFYAQISETGGGIYFYYNTPENLNDFKYSLEIPFNFYVNEGAFEQMEDDLFELCEKMREIFKKHDQELWYSFTMSVERNGEFKIHYDYTDWFKTDYLFDAQKIIWKYKYLGIKPAHPNDQKVIEKYLDEYPDNPI